MTETRPCKCENDFKDFELMYEGPENTAWVTINRDYHDLVEYANGAGRHFLRLDFSGNDGMSMYQEKIFYCPWCGRKLGKDS